MYFKEQIIISINSLFVGHFSTLNLNCYYIPGFLDTHSNTKMIDKYIHRWWRFNIVIEQTLKYIFSVCSNTIICMYIRPSKWIYILYQKVNHFFLSCFFRRAMKLKAGHEVHRYENIYVVDLFRAQESIKWDLLR